MATNQTAKTTEAKAKKVKKVKKDPIPVYVRLTKSMKSEAMRGRLTADELDKIATLAGGLKAFISA